MFITFEGIDGSGKSTQIALLRDKLLEEGHKVTVFREPGGTEVSEKIRALLLNPDFDIHPVTELLLFSSARAQLISEKVRPLLNKNEVVILDRFYDSTTAYQGYGRSSLPLQDIHRLNKIASHNIVPDITFYLKISLEEAQNRTALKSKDRMERSGKQFYEDVIEGFDTLADKEKRFIAVDAERPSEHVHKIIWKKIHQEI